MSPAWKKILKIVGILVVLFVLIQFIPFGKNHVNPPVVQEPKWDSPQTEKLVRGACYDCHSNESTYPWYSNVAPASWMLQLDINEGRSILNFSDLTNQQGAGMMVTIERQISRGSMPPFYYTPFHKEAQLSAEQRQQLITGLKTTFSQ